MSTDLAGILTPDLPFPLLLDSSSPVLPIPGYQFQVLIPGGLS